MRLFRKPNYERIAKLERELGLSVEASTHPPIPGGIRPGPDTSHKPCPRLYEWEKDGDGLVLGRRLNYWESMGYAYPPGSILSVPASSTPSQSVTLLARRSY